jgi:sugar lactone lactonase YvrE
MKLQRKSEPMNLFVRAAFATLLICSMAICLTAPAARAASSALWVADADNDQVDEYLPSQLRSSGSPLRLTIPISGSPGGVCFDESHDLWVVTSTEIFGFRPSALKKLPVAPNPAITIGSSSFGDINGCAFDQHGSLWVVDEDSNSLYKISAKQLKSSNPNITPAVTISSNDMASSAPGFVTFDHAGNLWTDGRDTDELFKFSAAQLTSSGNKPAKVVLMGGNSLFDPGQIGFDPEGNLWVPSWDVDTVVMFRKNQLKASNNDPPAITISSSTLVGPWGLHFRGGHLWVMDYSDTNAQEFLPSQLKINGSPTPHIILTGVAARNSWGITFGPAFGILE